MKTNKFLIHIAGRTFEFCRVSYEKRIVYWTLSGRAVYDTFPIENTIITEAPVEITDLMSRPKRLWPDYDSYTACPGGR